MPEPVRKKPNHGAEVEGFIDTLFEGQEGFIYTPTKNPATGYWQTYFFSYPDQKQEAVMHVMDATRSKEVYIAPSLFSKPKAKQTAWLGTNFVWVEFDGNAPATVPKGIPAPSIRIQSSTKGHEHWYWRLDHFETEQAIVEGLSKQLTYTLDADKSGWDANQVLRPPGTLHHDTKRRVRLLVAQNHTVSLSDFVDLVAAPEEVVVNTNITDLPDLQDTISKYKFPNDARELFKKASQPTGSRSSAMMRMAFHCVEMGMTNEEAYVILLNCDDRWGKYKNRTPENRAKVLTGMIAHARNEKSVQAEQRLSDYEPMYTVQELLDLDYSKIDWTFKEVISDNSYSIIAADPGIGKSTIAMQMGFAVALGQDFLKWEFGGKAGIKVGYFSYEMDARQCGHFIRTMLPGYGNNEQEVLRKNFYVRPTGYSIYLDRDDEQQKFLDYVDQHELSFIVVDSLKAINALEEKKYDKIQRFFDKDLRGERGCTILTIHHNRKPPVEGRTGEQTLADLYGDVFIQAGATHVLGLRAKANNEIEIAQTKNRLAPTFETFRVKRKDHMAFEIRATGKEDSNHDGGGGNPLSGKFKL